MKRFFISMAALLAVVGCAQQEDLVSADLGAANAPEFEVGFESSRVFINETDGVFKLAWTKGDLLSCFLNTGGQAQYEYVGETGSDYGIIKAVSCPSGEAIDAFYAVYPYNETNALADGILTVTLPAEQDYAEGTFAPNANTMVSINAAKEPYYTFSNVCGFIRLKVYGDATITSIEFKGNNEEVIAGTATVDPASENKALTIAGEGKTITLNCGEGVTLGTTEAEATEFWLVVPPMSFDEGFTVVMTDSKGEQMIKVLDTAFTIERNAVHKGEIEYKANSSLKDGGILFDAKFNTDGSATNAGTDSSLEIVSKLGESDAVIERGGMYVATFNNIIKTNDTAEQGYYFIDYSQNDTFKKRLENGFTMEVVSRTALYLDNYWAKPFASTSFFVHHSQIPGCSWGFAANTAEDSWGNAGSFGWNWLHPVSVRAYDHVILSYDGSGNWTFIVNGVVYDSYTTNAAFAAGNALAIGALPYTDGTARHTFVGDVAIARIYDKAYTVEEAQARHTELESTIAALNEAAPVETPRQFEMLADIQFKNNAEYKPIAEDIISNLPITTKYMGSQAQNLWVKQASDAYGLNNIATFGTSKANMTYFDVDYTNIKEAMYQDGFTIEVVHHDSRALTDGGNGWRGLFGSADFGMWLNEDSGSYLWDGRVWPGAVGINYGINEISANEWHHTLFAYDASAGALHVYTDGKYEISKNCGPMRDTKNMLAIGARYFSNGVDLDFPWGGDMALFRIYKGSMTDLEAAKTYNEIKDKLEELKTAVVVPQLTMIADVQFNTDKTAKETVNNLTVESLNRTAGVSNLSVAAPASGYTLNNIATFGVDEANMSYFALDYNGILSQMQDGFTIEVIHHDKRVAVTTANGWHGLFGSADFGLWLNEDPGRYLWDGRVWPSAAGINYGINEISANKWHHTMFVYDKTTGSFQVYTDGVNEINLICGEMRTSAITKCMIGGRYFSNGRDMGLPWGGDIALFRIYDEAATIVEVNAYYQNVKSQIDILDAAL